MVNRPERDDCLIGQWNTVACSRPNAILAKANISDLSLWSVWTTLSAMYYADPLRLNFRRRSIDGLHDVLDGL